MVNVAETTGYDLIGGSLNKHERSPWAKSDFMNIRPSPSGFCFHRGIYQHLELPGNAQNTDFDEKSLRFYTSIFFSGEYVFELRKASRMNVE